MAGNIRGGWVNFSRHSSALSFRPAAHWARIQKKVQKPPQSTHQIPGFFLSKNPERVDCGGIFISKFFKKNQKLAEINEKSSDPLKRG